MSAHHLKTPLGRDRETLEVAAAVLADRSVLITGEPGIGKTTILEAALTVAGLSAPIVRATPAAKDLPLLPLRSAFQAGLLTGTTEGIGARLVRHLGGGPLVVDDLHWCDRDTLKVLAEASLRVAVVATVWSTPGPAAELVEALEQSAQVVHIEPLGDDAARRLVRARRPGATDSDLDEWVAHGAGNPLVLECLAETGSLASDSSVALERVQAYVAALDGTAIESLARAAVIGRPVDAIEIGPGLEALIQGGLVTTGTVGVAVRHERFGVAALALLGGEAELQLHRWAAGVSTNPSERAYHLSAAGDPTAAEAALEASTRTESLLEQAQLLEIAARQAPVEDAELVMRAGEALVDAGLYESAENLLAEFTPPESGLAARRAVALARSTWARNDMEAARCHVEAGLALLGGSRTTAEVDLLSIRTRISARVDWDAAAALASAEGALSIATETDEGLGVAHGAMGTALLRVGDARFVDHLRRAIDLAGGDDVAAAIAGDTLFMGQMLMGDARACRPLAEEMVARTKGVSGLWEQQSRKNALLAALHVEGDYDAVLTEAPHILRAPATPRIREHTEATLVLAHADRGEVEAALRVAAPMSGLSSADLTARAMAFWAIAETHWLAGRPELGREAAREAASVPVSGFPAHVLASVVGAWCSYELGLATDTWAAESPFTNLEAARLEIDGLRALGTDPQRALDAFRRAEEAWRGSNRRAALRVQWAVGEAALASGDEHTARDHLAAAEEEAVATSSRALLRRIRRSLRAAGIRRRDVSKSDSGLSPTEQLVLQLIGHGLTSREIAKRLAVSATTVDTHVRGAMHKLGAPTRLAAAVQATAERRSPEDARYTLTSTSRDHAELLRERRRGGCDLVPLASAARSYPGAQANSVAEGSVSTLEDASSVIAAAYRGHSVVACLDAAPAPMRTVLTDSLRRLGLVELREHGERRAPALTALQQRVLDGLSRGATIAHLAAEEGLSRRTVERRLAQARDLLGAETTTEAVTRHRQRDRFNKTEELGGGDGV